MTFWVLAFIAEMLEVKGTLYFFDIRYSQQIICCGQEVMAPVFLIVLNMRMIQRMKIRWCYI